MIRFYQAMFLVIALVLIIPSAAFAQDELHTQPTLPINSTQLYAMLIGGLVPLVTYLLNHYAPWVSDEVKFVVHVVVAGAAGGLYQALSTDSFGFNTPTLEIVGGAVFAALVAHKIAWQPSGWAAKLKAGTNVQDKQ